VGPYPIIIQEIFEIRYFCIFHLKKRSNVRIS